MSESEHARGHSTRSWKSWVFEFFRIDDFVRTRPPLLSRDPGLMSEYAEVCRSRFFDRRANSLERTLERADTALARLEGELR